MRRPAAGIPAGNASRQLATASRSSRADARRRGRTDLSAHGDGGTPLVQALFWGHREVAELLGWEPVNLRVAAGTGDLELIRNVAGTAQAGMHRGFYRPHGEGVTAMHLAAQSGQREAVVTLLQLGADPLILDDRHGGNALGWARIGGHEDLADILLTPN